MPSFDHADCHRFWHDYHDKYIYRVICFMEGVEDWTLDGDPKVEAAINELGEALDDVGNIDLKQEENIIKIGAYIKSGRVLRILMALDMAYPGAAAKILMHSEDITNSDGDLPGLFLRRNVVFERLRLLGRVFDPDRCKIILSALEEGGYE